MKSVCLVTALILPSLLSAQVKGSLSPDALYAQSKGSVVTILTFDTQKSPLSQGSGFVIAKNRVVTNYHVLAGSASASVVFDDGTTTMVGSVIAASLPKDIVIVNVVTGIRIPLPLGNELDLKIGEPVYAIGAPHGLSASFSNGLVSAFREDEGQFLIQTTAAIAPGSSGGPLLNAQGHAVGITTSRLKDSGFGFAVGSSDIQRLLRAPLLIAIALSDLPDNTTDSGTDELKPVRALLDAKKYTDALASLQKASAQTQVGYDGQLLLCEIKEKVSDYQSALEACDAAIQIKPDSAEAIGKKAFTLYMSGDLASAETVALRASKLSNEEYYAHLLGLIYYSEEKYSLVPKLLSSESKSTFELTLLEGAALRIGDKVSFQKARDRIATLKGPDNGWQLYFDGAQAQRDLSFDTALEKYRKCDADDDFIDSVCITSAASVEATKGAREAAKSDIDLAVKRYPRNHSVLSEAIFIDLVTGNSADAKRLHRALESLPREAGDDAGDCLYYYGINQAANATEYCAASIKGHENIYTAWSNAGYVALDNGQYSAAFSYFAKARQLFDSTKEKHTGIQDMDVNWGLTLGAFYGGDKKDAKALYRSLKKLYPDYSTMAALKQLPLVWSDTTQELVSKVINTFQ